MTVEEINALVVDNGHYIIRNIHKLVPSKSKK